MKRQVVLITGASRGIGLATADLFRQNDYSVIAPSRTELDLLSDVSVDNYCNSLESQNICVDVLVNNAGINPVGEISLLSDQNINDTFKVNLLSPLRLTRAIIRQMIPRNQGKIVNISSIWAQVSKPGRVIYSSTKSGIEGMTRALAVECAKYGILVNSVAPGYTATEMTSKNNSPQQLQEISRLIPLGRLAQPVEIAKAVFFLASEQNSYITGQVLYADGGFTCQ